jgi:hypothetical protein
MSFPRVSSLAVGAATAMAMLPAMTGVASAATPTPTATPTTTASPTASPTPTATPTPTPVVPVALGALTDHTVGSAVAPNGDTHPYSVAVVPSTYSGAPLAAGDVLVGDFANTAGVKGQGKSIVRFHLGAPSLFSTAVTGPVAATFNAAGTALWVAGYGATDNGSAGSITALHTVTGTVPGPGPGVTPSVTPTASVAGDPFTGGAIADTHGPWGIESNDSATTPVFFWANADGTIVRDTKITDPFGTSTSTANVQTTLATLSHGTSPSAAGGTVVAPQGLVYDAASDTLYIADSQSDQIVALAGAATATGPITPTVMVKGGPLHTPRGLALDANTGDLLVTNGAVDNNLVELTKAGAVVTSRNLDPKGAVGAIAGLATTKDAAGQTEVYYANDNTNTLHLLSATTDPVSIDGPVGVTAPYGSEVTISGRAPAGSSVGIFFHRANVAGYVQRRTLQADSNGVFVTSFAPNDDYRYYAQVGTKASAIVLEQATPSVVGPTSRLAKKNATIVLVGHGVPHGSVLLHFHKAGAAATDYSLLRSVHVAANGVWTKPVKLSVDYRVYASRGVLHPYTVRYLLQGI